MILNRYITNNDRFFLLLEIIAAQMPESCGHPDQEVIDRFQDVAGILSIPEQELVMNRYFREMVENDMKGGHF